MWKIGSKCARLQVASSLLASLHLTLFLAAERKITPEVSPTKSCTWMVASISLTELLCGPDYYSSSGCHLQHSRTELVMGSFTAAPMSLSRGPSRLRVSSLLLSGCVYVTTTPADSVWPCLCLYNFCPWSLSQPLWWESYSIWVRVWVFNAICTIGLVFVCCHI